MNERFKVLLSNKHTTGAAAVYAACELAMIWFPEWSAQLLQTQSWALVYGLLLAGDSKPLNGNPNENTPPAPPPPPAP